MLCPSLAYVLQCGINVNSNIFEVIAGPWIIDVFDAVYDWATSYSDNVLVAIWVRPYEAGRKAPNMQSENGILVKEGVW